MPRQLKPQQVDEIEHRRAHITIPLMFNRNDINFFADFAGRTYKGKDADTVRTLVMDAIDKSLQCEWVRVLTISHVNYEYAGQGLRDRTFSFNMDRFLIGSLSTGVLKRLNWETAEHTDDHVQWIARSSDFYWDKEKYGIFELPTQKKQYNDLTYYRVYREQDWQTLLDFEKWLNILRDRFFDWVSIDAPLMSNLLEGSNPLLMLPGPKGEE